MRFARCRGFDATTGARPVCGAVAPITSEDLVADGEGTRGLASTAAPERSISSILPRRQSPVRLWTGMQDKGQKSWLGLPTSGSRMRPKLRMSPSCTETPMICFRHLPRKASISSSRVRRTGACERTNRSTIGTYSRIGCVRESERRIFRATSGIGTTAGSSGWSLHPTGTSHIWSRFSIASARPSKRPEASGSILVTPILRDGPASGPMDAKVWETHLVRGAGFRWVVIARKSNFC